MKSKTKTLKDIAWIQKYEDGTIIATDTRELRQSAIEDIKELKKGDYLQITNGLPVTDSRSLTFRDVDKKALILWIMWKFNINPRDLK